FRRHIYPTFRRLGLAEWVASAANLRQGWLGIGDFIDPEYLSRLADPSSANAQFRASIFSKFRNPHNLGADAYKEERLKMPYMPGDGINYDGSPLQWFQFPMLQYSFLQHWAAGEFVNDMDDPEADAVNTLDDIDVSLQPQALN